MGLGYTHISACSVPLFSITSAVSGVPRLPVPRLPRLPVVPDGTTDDTVPTTSDANGTAAAKTEFRDPPFLVATGRAFGSVAFLSFGLKQKQRMAMVRVGELLVFFAGYIFLFLS